MIIEGIKITNDYIFKKIFDDTEILRDFISCVISEKISSLEIINSDVLPESIGDKLSRLDILAETEKREKINIEMQLSYHDGFDDRMTFYAMRLHSGNFKEGEKYSDIKRTIVIDILDFEHKLLSGRKEFCTDFRLRSSDGIVTLTNKFIIYFVELAKIPEGAIENLTKLEKWLMFLKNEGGKEMLQVLEREPMIKRAMTVAEALAKDKKERMIAQYREDAIRDYYSGINTSFDKGISVGKLETARNFLSMGVSPEIIYKATGLSEEDIKQEEER